jgi:hypothetical protein
MTESKTTDRPPEGYHFAGPDEFLAIKHFRATQKALYDLAGLFVTGPLNKERKRPEVRAAFAALAQIPKDKPGMIG